MATTKTRERSASRRQQQAAKDEPQATGSLSDEARERYEQAVAHDIEQAEQAKGEEQAKPEPEAKPELPLATGDLGAYPITYYKPRLVLPDGTEIVHPGKWGTEHPKIAEAWLRKTAAEHGVRVEVPV